MYFTQTTTALSALACLAISAAAFAGTSDIKASNNQIAFQVMSTYVDYTETGTGQYGTPIGTLDTETGWVPGFAVSVAVMKDLWLGNDYIEAGFDHSSGNTRYVGGYIGPPATPYGSVVGTSGATLTDYSARYGKGFLIDKADDEVVNDFMLTAYAEIGHHIWDRGVNSGETYSHHYIGIGALGQYSPVGKLVVSGNVLIGETFGSYITANPAPGFSGFSGGLGNSAIYKVEIGADYVLAENLHGNIVVDHTGFSYGISAVYGGYFEPDSNTDYTTVRVGLGYAF